MRHLNLSPIGALLTAFTISLAPLQSLAAQTIKDVRGGLEFAEYEIDHDRHEKAAEALRDAYLQFKLLPAAERGKDRRVEKEITTLMRKCDPKGKQLVDSAIKNAKQLRSLAVAYQRKGWDQTAFSVLLQAQTLCPALVASDLKKLRAKFDADAGRRFETAGKNKTLLTWFHLGERRLGSAPWIFSDYGIMAPKTSEKTGEQHLISNKKLTGDVRIKIDVKPGPSGHAEFIWNHQEVKRGNRKVIEHCSIDLNPRKSHFSVLQIEKSTSLSIGEGTLIMDSFKNKWISLEIEIRGKQVVVKVPDNDPMKFTMIATNDGSLGLSFETANRGDPQAQFRHLVIEYLD